MGMLRDMGKKRKEYTANQDLTRKELEAKKLGKFRDLARYANAHSSWYARIIREHGINLDTCIPEDFPVLTKSQVIEHFDELVTDPRLSRQVITDFLSRSKTPGELLFNKYYIIHTSGSSGQLGYFVFSKEDWAAGLAQNPRTAPPRIRRGFRRVRMAYYAATDGHYAGVSIVSSIKHSILRLFVNVRLYNVNDPLDGIIEDLNSFQPDSMVGYTTALKILAEQQLKGNLHIKPFVIGSSGEAMNAGDRELFKKAFDCIVGNSYACSEHMVIGFSNEDGKTMTIYDDELIIEFHHDHSVVTNLFNSTLPLIRYRMADIMEPIPEDKSHAPYLTVKAVVGRSEIVPYFINQDGEKDFISPFAIIELFIPGATRFQMQLTGASSFDFALCVDPKLDPAGKDEVVQAARHRLQEILDQKNMQNVNFNVVLKDEIPVNPKTGKFQLILPQQ